MLAGLLFLLARSFNNEDPEVTQVTVPGVVTLDVTAATQALEAEGFEGRGTEFVNDPGPAPNQVTAQDPEAGAEADEGSTVRRALSRGPELVAVPDVVGRTQERGEPDPHQAGFVVNVVRRARVEEDPRHLPGPAEAPATPSRRRSPSGSRPARALIPIPEVAGQTEATPRANLNSAGFTSITVQNEENDDLPAGTVIRVDPAPGTEVPANQPITLVLSGSRQQVTVPPVEGLNEQNARNQLEAAGLSVTVSQQDVSNPGQDGRVLSQSPAANRQASTGATRSTSWSGG